MNLSSVRVRVFCGTTEATVRPEELPRVIESLSKVKPGAMIEARPYGVVRG